MNKKYITTSAKQTQELGKRLAEKVLKLPPGRSAKILGLQGNLGGGKTTFLQGFAKGLGIKEKILSPTFVIMKKFDNFYHFDCYRINKPEEILELGFEEIISNPENIVAIEWPEKILPRGKAGKKVLPKNTILVKFKFLDKNRREINFKM